MNNICQLTGHISNTFCILHKPYLQKTYTNNLNKLFWVLSLYAGVWKFEFKLCRQKLHLDIVHWYWKLNKSYAFLNIQYRLYQNVPEGLAWPNQLLHGFCRKDAFLCTIHSVIIYGRRNRDKVNLPPSCIWTC